MNESIDETSINDEELFQSPEKKTEEVTQLELLITDQDERYKTLEENHTKLKNTLRALEAKLTEEQAKTRGLEVQVKALLKKSTDARSKASVPLPKSVVVPQAGKDNLTGSKKIDNCLSKMEKQRMYSFINDCKQQGIVINATDRYRLTGTLGLEAHKKVKSELEQKLKDKSSRKRPPLSTVAALEAQEKSEAEHVEEQDTNPITTPDMNLIKLRDDPNNATPEVRKSRRLQK